MKTSGPTSRLLDRLPVAAFWLLNIITSLCSGFVLFFVFGLLATALGAAPAVIGISGLAGSGLGLFVCFFGLRRMRRRRSSEDPKDLRHEPVVDTGHELGMSAPTPIATQTTSSPALREPAILAKNKSDSHFAFPSKYQEQTPLPPRSAPDSKTIRSGTLMGAIVIFALAAFAVPARLT